MRNNNIIRKVYNSSFRKWEKCFPNLFHEATNIFFSNPEIKELTLRKMYRDHSRILFMYIFREYSHFFFKEIFSNVFGRHLMFTSLFQGCPGPY